jgi:hypothetical protein
MSFICNDNMREKRETNANANVLTRWFMIGRAVMAYKGTETDHVLYDVEMA